MSRIKGTTQGTPADFQWTFPWRRRHPRLRPMVLPVGLAGLAFVVMLGMIRVKVASPQFEMERRGSLVYLPSDGDGLAWAIRASEAGPELSRYEPSAWGGFAGLEEQVMAATLVPLPVAAPKLRELPAAAAPDTVQLAPVGVPVLPSPDPAPVQPLAPRQWRMVPVLLPLSPLGGAAMPESLPPVTGRIDLKMAEVEWRFLLRLRPDGTVEECLALTKNADGAGLLEGWLKQIRFDPRLALHGGWFGVAVSFNNRTDDGTDDH